MDKFFASYTGRQINGNETQNNYSQFYTPTSLWIKLLDVVSRYHDSISIIDSGGAYSYDVLKNRANKIAYELKLHGAKQGTRVGVLLPRGIDQVASFFAISKIGAIFVPLAKNIKLNYIVKDSELSLIICKSTIDIIGNAIPCITLPPLKGHTEVKYIDEDDHVLANDKNTCAIIYTSGTTADPKGVLINHRMLINYSVAAKSYMNLLPTARFALYPPIIYIDTIQLIVTVLFSGAILYLMTERDVQKPEKISLYLERHNITHFYIHAEMARDVIPNKELQFFQTGGTTAKEHVYNNLSPMCIYSNGYGLTEAGAFLVWRDNGSRKVPIPLGKPIPNTYIFIVNNGKLCTGEEIGELCVAGDCLSNGYVRDYAGTESRFADNPFGEGLLLHTGDMACWNEFGEIIYKGRINASNISDYTEEQLENGIMERCEHCRVVCVRSNSMLYVFAQLSKETSLNMIQQAVEGHFQKLGLRTDNILIRTVENFPYTGNNKISKKFLLSQVTLEEEF
jgi:acyl-coenzyme A synthetase/AMP-(fatty) acid ligase